MRFRAVYGGAGGTAGHNARWLLHICAVGILRRGIPRMNGIYSSSEWETGSVERRHRYPNLVCYPYVRSTYGLHIIPESLFVLGNVDTL
jgi:hypothetical protein